MTLSKLQRDALWLFIWQEPRINKLPDWFGLHADCLGPLVQAGLLTVTDGIVRRTALGFETLSPMARTSCQRPKDHFDQPESDQWATDKRLGILDWDGT